MLTEILAFVKLTSQVLGIAKPIIDEKIIHKHQEEANERLETWQDVLNEPDPERKRERIAGYMGRLCNSTGYPPGRLSGTSVEVPVEYFHSLVLGNIQLVKMNEDLIHVNSAFQQVASK